MGVELFDEDQNNVKYISTHLNTYGIYWTDMLQYLHYQNTSWRNIQCSFLQYTSRDCRIYAKFNILLRDLMLVSPLICHI